MRQATRLKNMSSAPADRQDNPLLRLNKALARTGICSRRAADALILNGEVQVNEHVVRMPGTRIDPGKDRLCVRGVAVCLPQADSSQHLYLALNKPSTVVTTARDPQGRPTVLDLLPVDLQRRRPFPVGRLDRMSEGLLLLTTDGDLAQRLTHPRYEHPKTYHVWVCGRVSPKKLEAMRSGMRLAEGEQLAPVQVRPLHREADKTLLEMVLCQGVNRQIRRMCRDLHLHLTRLTRVQQGPVNLDGLPPGAWRHLNPQEVQHLKHFSGLSRAHA
jgi:23S rRNA pseudouridine2605 synthase